MSEKEVNLVESCDIGPASARKRPKQAYQLRNQAALFQMDLPNPGHPCNGDENLFTNKIGNFSKGLPHNHLGEVDLNAYRDMIRALSTGNPDDFEFIPLGGLTKLASPQTAYAFEMVGPDTHHLSTNPAPAFSSAWNASEMAELYWLALTRDVPFTEYNTDPATLAAAADLSNNFSDFRGPKVNGKVTPDTLFRGNTPGDLTGPYISQFLWKDIPYGATTIVQRYRTTMAGVDHMTSYEDWLNTQNGFPSGTNQFDPQPRYIRNGRDLGEYTHRDFTFQGFLSACLILLSYGSAALAPNNPYLRSATQIGRSTFGAPHILDFVARATRTADMAAWYQKWLVHRRLRPEEFGGRVHNLLTGAANYPINQELLDSQAVAEVFSKFGTYLLPQAYAEGCPTHPAYPAGHACVAGAGATMLKAFFKESFIIPNPVVASADGLSLLPYSGPALTVGGELNKLASNIGLGRNAAGVHWRSDGEGLKLGEAVAIGILQDYRKTYNEDFGGFTFTKFDGTIISI